MEWLPKTGFLELRKTAKSGRGSNFPPNIKGIIAILRTWGQHDPTTKSFTHKYIENLCLFHGKLPDENILKLTILELAIEIQTNE